MRQGWRYLHTCLTRLARASSLGASSTQLKARLRELRPGKSTRGDKDVGAAGVGSVVAPITTVSGAGIEEDVDGTDDKHSREQTRTSCAARRQRYPVLRGAIVEGGGLAGLGNEFAEASTFRRQKNWRRHTGDALSAFEGVRSLVMTARRVPLFVPHFGTQSFCRSAASLATNRAESGRPSRCPPCGAVRRRGAATRLGR